MCTSLIHNGKKTIVGWNLDILDMKYKIMEEENGVYIAIFDEKEGWMPLFGANKNGSFVGMPTCWPYDAKSDPVSEKDENIIMLDIDMLLGKKSFEQIKEIVAHNRITSVPGLTFQAQLSDREGNVLQIIPGQGYFYKEKPKFSVMTNFSPIKGDSEFHPWMGLDRYRTATEMLKKADENFDVKDCFAILKENTQTVCPTVVSMVYDVTENKVYWCEAQDFDHIERRDL